MEPLRSVVDPSSTALIPELLHLYGGDLAFPAPPPERPYVVLTFVEPWDGVLSYADVKGRELGGEISGFNPQDQFVLALLRTYADAIIIGAETLRKEGDHIWSGPKFDKAHASLLSAQRAALGKPVEIINAFLTNSGNIPLGAPVFHDPEIIPLVFTSPEGMERIRAAEPSETIGLYSANPENPIRDMLETLRKSHHTTLALVESPSIADACIREGVADELFITLSPYLVGNSRETNRPTLLRNTPFGPDNSPQVEIVSEKAWQNYRYFRLRLRYRHL